MHVKGAKEVIFYSLPFGQAEASIYLPKRHFNWPPEFFDDQKMISQFFCKLNIPQNTSLALG